MEAARAADLFELLAQAAHAVADLPTVGFDLGFARAAKEAKTTALTLKVSPGPYKATGLVIQMREFDLKTPFGGGGAFAKDFKNQAGTVDDLALQPIFEIALLDGRKRTVDDDQFGVGLVARNADTLDLTFSEQRGRTDGADREDEGINYLDADGAGQPLPFFEA